MSNCGCFVARLAALLGIAFATITPPSADAASSPGANAGPQVVVLISGRNVLGRQLPAFMQIQPGRFLAAREVERACRMPRLKADSLLLYLPDSQRCEQISVQGQITLRRRLQKLTGRWPLPDVKASMRNQPFLALAPARHALDQATANCGCLNNVPPIAVTTCAAQARTVSTPIGQVQFLANDVDSTSLSSEFTYRLDSGPVQAGLPSPLDASCASGSGTLQCTVSGQAPASAGILQLNLTVSDGTSTVPVWSLLNVLAVGDQVFADGFDLPGCP